MQDKKYYDNVKMKKQKLIFSHEITSEVIKIQK